MELMQHMAWLRLVALQHAVCRPYAEGSRAMLTHTITLSHAKTRKHAVLA